jgi:hypothetical protein
MAPCLRRTLKDSCADHRCGSELRSRSDWADKLPLFAAEIKRIFTADELARYFAATTRIGAAAHVSTDDEYAVMRDAGMFDEDVVSGAADALLFERARALLLDSPTSSAAQ